MPITLTSHNDLNEIKFKFQQALQRPTKLLIIYIFILYLYTSAILLLHGFLLWVRWCWNCWTATVELLGLPFVLAVRIQIYAIFWTLETYCDALTWCWNCVDKLAEKLERPFPSLKGTAITSPHCSVALPRELLPMILGHLLGDRKSLIKCTYVSRLFHDEANRVLWGNLSLRHGSDIKRAYHGLVIFLEPNVPVIDRRPLIRTLEIKKEQRNMDAPPSPNDYSRLIQHLPSLKKLVIENRTLRRMNFLSDHSPACRPNLEIISLRDNGLNPGFWAFVQVHDKLKVLHYSPKLDIAVGSGIYLGDPEESNARVSFKPGTMPNLETIAAPASIVCKLVPGRPVKFVRIEGHTAAGDSEWIVNALGGSTAGIRRLDLEVSLLDVKRLMSRLSRLESLEELILRCPEAYRWRAIAPDSGLPHGGLGFKSLRRLSFVFRNYTDVIDYYQAKVQPFQAARPRPTEIAIQGRWSTYIWSWEDGWWTRRAIDHGGLGIEI